MKLDRSKFSMYCFAKKPQKTCFYYTVVALHGDRFIAGHCFSHWEQIAGFETNMRILPCVLLAARKRFTLGIQFHMSGEAGFYVTADVSVPVCAAIFLRCLSTLQHNALISHLQDILKFAIPSNGPTLCILI